MTQKLFIYWDNGNDVVPARVFPRPMPESWHRKYQENHRKNPKERDRFEPIAEFTTRETLLQAVADGRKIQAKAILTGAAMPTNDPYADVDFEDAAGNFDAATEPPATPEPEIPPKEEGGAPITAEEIEQMDRDTLKMWAKELGVKVGRSTDATLKVKLTKAINKA